jgi:hypothetical protein
MRASLLLLLLVPPVARAAGVEEIWVSDSDHGIVLRADGTAEYSYRGRWDQVRTDERVGAFRARFDPREFRRLAALPGATGFEDLKDFRVAFPTRIVHVTVVRDGRRRSLEWQDRRLASDPEPPAALWGLEMAARGLAAGLEWEPIPSGVRVRLGGESKEVREVMVREAESRYPVAGVRTHKGEVEVPVRPGVYLVEVSTLRGDRWTDAKKTTVTVEAGKYAPVAADR